MLTLPAVRSTIVHRRRRGPCGRGIIAAVAAMSLAPVAALSQSPAAASVTVPTGTTAPDYVSSDNVKLVRRLPLVADGVGARVVGHYLYVTSTKDLEIYDIATPGDPQRVGSVNVDVEFENEQVPTNGTVLGISGQTGAITPTMPCPPTGTRVSCLAIFDVRDKAHPRQVAAVNGAGDHTSTCVLGCSYMYGSAGHITDLRGVLGPDHTARLTNDNWVTYLKSKGYPFFTSPHHQTEIRPGIVLTASDPMYLLSLRAVDGASATRPKVLGRADYLGAPEDQKRFVHGVEWPRQGFDKIMLSGGETNFQPTCGPTNGAFSTFVNAGTATAPKFRFVDEVRPVPGNYLDGNPPQGTYALGCSVHWFEPHPTFHNGGLVALASYENGTRFKRIAADGKITEVGFFEPIKGATSAPHWAPDGRTLYAIDYERGLDVLRYTGPLFVPTTG